MNRTDAIVVGGGLSGLAAATLLTLDGLDVTVLEAQHDLGGRAQTDERHGFVRNLGAHALYRAGAAAALFRRLGVPTPGGVPEPNRILVVRDGRLEPAPVTLTSLARSRLLPPAARFETARLLARLPAPETGRGRTWRAWMDEEIRHTPTRTLFEMVSRLATYADDAERQDAGVVLAQLRRALSNVVLVDGGWRTLVDGLADRARAAGVTIRSDAPVEAVEHDGRRVGGVRLRRGGRLEADRVIVAGGGPHDFAALTGLPAPATTPVRLAAFDVALRRLPRPNTLYALGWDAPLYLSVHSAWARLAPPGGAVLSCARYLGATPPDPAAHRAELEALVDLAQPGWRDEVVAARFLPNLTVAHDLPLAGRPRHPAHTPVPGLAVAGDWVGPEGLLTDAAVASAEQAVAAVRGRVAVPA
jgi:phytoene dehydrogenase-like protein